MACAKFMEQPSIESQTFVPKASQIGGVRRTCSAEKIDPRRFRYFEIVLLYAKAGKSW